MNPHRNQSISRVFLCSLVFSLCFAAGDRARGAVLSSELPDISEHPGLHETTLHGALSDVLGRTEAASGGEAQTLSIWSALIDLAKLNRINVIVVNYPKYAGVAEAFVLTGGEWRWKRFWNYHKTGDRRSARRVLRRFAGF